MDRRFRRWLRIGLAVGATLAGVAYYRRRVRTDAENRDTDPITERHSGAFLVRRRIEHDRIEDVRDAVCRRSVESRDDWLLGVERASTASLFLDRNGDDPDLVWYVEVPWAAVEAWDGTDPAATLSDAFPVAHEALSEADDAVDRALLVHAVHPARPRTTVVNGNATAASTSAERTDDAGRSVDVDLVRLDLESGLPERLADWFAALSRRVIDGEVTLDRIESWSVEMLEREAMFTESVFLERRADDYSLVGYMETASMEGVYDAYYDTWNPVARLSEVVLGRVLVEPKDILSYPLETDVELLAHATNPDRPRHGSEAVGSRTASEPN